MTAEGLAEATTRMRAHGEDDLAVRAFEASYARLGQILETGSGGVIPEDTIDPLTDVPALDDVADDGVSLTEALGLVAVVKLNGGLGTSMGVTGPKSALEVKDGLSFLDIICRQVLALREQHGVHLPLVLMNSFRTRETSLEILARYPDLAVDGLPLDFLQSAEPKLRADDLTPVDHPDDPDLEWCPPGHGDVYVSLKSSGLLQTLLDKGFRYVFLSNADNLGATCDPRIAAWILASDVPYVAEVCERTVNDRKGGHLAVRKSDGQLVLRDSAMVKEGEEGYFQDTARHTTFHANNLWVDLRVIDRLLSQSEEHGEVGLGLPVIVNRKTVDPGDSGSTPVIQIETAMGAAVERIEGARALFVPRTRFRPVKTTNELLLVRSDIFKLADDSSVVSVIAHADPYVDLDAHYKLVPGFEERFAHGVPSLRAATSFVVKGDVHFGADVVAVGDVVVDGSETPQVADGTTLGA
ncbi:MAG: UTP--glucose-1-phosphate uridylyltransferase [Actinomycetota bacterium]|nr:UTP--glucose-1-phosphate uridylyltransferase [Actinomycetota bacterium]